jgi:hypothetical protein
VILTCTQSSNFLFIPLGFATENSVFLSSSVFWDVTQLRLVVTDVSGQPVGPSIKDQAVQDDCSTLQDGADRLSRNVGNYQLTLCNIPE